MKFIVAFLLVLIYSKVDATSEAYLISLRDSSRTAFSNLESGGAYLDGLGYSQQKTDAVYVLSTLYSLAEMSLPPYNYPLKEEIANYDGSTALSTIVSILNTYASGAPADYRTYLESAYVYTIQAQQAVRNVANS
ncbi:hypothetical protein HA402_004319 [Bradysia odoriphaga]|nr:hypothetical protein HA402_004319 [Bradysia odoriphaga]